MIPRGVWPQGIQTGPFAACETYFILFQKNVHLNTQPSILTHLFVLQREEGEGPEAENGKMELIKSEWHHDPGA